MDNPDKDGAEIGMRWPELLVALLLAAAGALVIVDSLRIGIGWADDGPKSGYFPFYIGVALFAAAVFIGGQQLLAWRRDAGTFATHEQLGLVWAILWPMVIYVGLVATLGFYVGSLVLIAYFMARHGKHGAPLTAAVAVGVPLACFLVFERWFLVPLPKGPLETMLGL